MQRHRCLAASRRSLNYQNPVLRIADDRILFLLNCAENIIINFHITLKSVNHLSIPDLILPLGTDFPCHLAARSQIGSRPAVKIVEKTADRASPVVNQRQLARPLCKIADADIENFRLIIPVIAEIHTPEERRIQHFPEAAPQKKLLLIRIHLMQQRLLIVVILISVLVHLGIVLPVIIVHIFNFFLSVQQRLTDLGKTRLQLFQHKRKIFLSVFLVCHKRKPPLKNIMSSAGKPG